VIEVCDYDPLWIQRFDALRVEYEGAFRSAGVPFLSIEHVGSTSVPGLAAKPVIDIDIVVDSVVVNAASDVLESLGFEPRGEMGIPERWAFSAPKRLTGTHTYVVVAGSLALRNHLAVRETLRADPELRAQYAETKRDVGARAADIDAYIAGKNATLQRILVAAGFSDQERAAINDANQLPISERER
jgi:GrpB-like predicted nucleotidyltransferase (UPF0157 family)